MRVVLIVLSLVLASAATSVAADGRRSGHERWLAENGISLDRAVSRARKDYRGRVLSAETDEYKGRRSHKIRILTDEGRVRRLRVDPDTGRYNSPPRRRK